MNDRETENRISQLGDVELVRLLTIDASENTPQVIAIATAEANRRDLPIDEAFIPSAEDQTTSAAEAVGVSESRRFEAGGAAVLCPHCTNVGPSASNLLNTRGLTFLKLDWLNRFGAALVCARCGRIQLFAYRLRR